MTLIQIRYFLEICKESSITKAARELHVSQPSISNAIRDLENELGVKLFHRIKKRLSLTREGHYFKQKVTQIVAQLDLLTEEMKDIGNKRNRIRIGLPPMIGTFLFPEIFETFRKINPSISLEAVEQGSLKIHEMILEEKLDIALAITEPSLSDYINMIDIKKTTLQFCVSKKHHLANKKSIEFKELENEPLVLLQSGSYQNNIILSRFQQNNINPSISLFSNQFYTIKQMLLPGDVGTFLFEEMLEMDHDLVGIPLSEKIEFNIALIWKKERHIYSDTYKLIDVVKQHFVDRTL